MTKPNLIWAAYNLYRLAALVFISWTLVAQFISLAEDMDAVSRAVSLQSLGSTATASAAAAETSTTIGWSAIGTLSSPFNVKTAAIPVPDPAAPTGAATPTSTVGGPGPVVDTGVVPLPTGTAGLAPLIGHQGRRAIPSQHQKRDAVGAQKEELDEYVPGSSVPNRSGGGAFVVLGRLAMVGLLGVTALAQAGLPETFLYNRLAWLGPQSTLLWLGILQFILAIENLRVYSRADLLIGSWGLLAFGSANSLIGILLSWLGRRLPKHPPHALYFNRSVRLLFLRPDPPFYSQLDTRQSRPEEYFEDVEKAPIKRALPPSNAREIGLDDTADEDERDSDWNMVSPPKRARQAQDHAYRSEPYDSMDPRNRPVSRPGKNEKKSRKESVASGLHATLGNQVLPAVRAPAPTQGLRPEQDVAQGGYPTFASGGGLDDPRRQVPTGLVEQSSDGRAILFIKEDGREAGQTGPNIDFDPRGQLDIPAQEPQSTLPAKTTGVSGSQTGSRKGTDVKSKRKSSLDAAAELAPRFPVPPTRAISAPGQSMRSSPRPSQKSNLAVNTTAAVPPSRAARLKEMLSPTDRSGLATTAPADAQPGEQGHHPAPVVDGDDDDAELVIELADEARGDDMDELASPPITPGNGASKSPYTPVLSAKQHVAMVVKLSRANSRSVTPSAAPTGSAALDPPVAHEIRETQTGFVEEPEPIDPSGPPDNRQVARQSSMRRGRDARPPSKGVRFDLTDVEEVTEPESSPSPPMTSASSLTPPKTGLRIPGTNVHLPLPFASPSPATTTEARSRDSRRFSSGSMASFADISASDTDGFFTPSEPLQTPRDGRPELLARHSSGTLAPADVRRSIAISKPARPRSALILRSALKSEDPAERPRRRSSVSFA